MSHTQGQAMHNMVPWYAGRSAVQQSGRHAKDSENTLHKRGADSSICSSVAPLGSQPDLLFHTAIYGALMLLKPDHGLSQVHLPESNMYKHTCWPQLFTVPRHVCANANTMYPGMHVQMPTFCKASAVEHGNFYCMELCVPTTYKVAAYTVHTYLYIHVYMCQRRIRLQHTHVAW